MYKVNSSVIIAFGKDLVGKECLLNEKYPQEIPCSSCPEELKWQSILYSTSDVKNSLRIIHRKYDELSSKTREVAEDYQVQEIQELHSISLHGGLIYRKKVISLFSVSLCMTLVSFIIAMILVLHVGFFIPMLIAGMFFIVTLVFLVKFLIPLLIEDSRNFYGILQSPNKEHRDFLLKNNKEDIIEKCEEAADGCILVHTSMHSLVLQKAIWNSYRGHRFIVKEVIEKSV